MQAVEWKPGVARVVEAREVEGPQLGVDARVLDVARHAVGRDVAVDAYLRGNALRDRAVAGQALVSRDLPPLGVALQALVHPFEGRVRLAEASRRDQRAQLRGGDRRDGKVGRDHQCRGRQPASHATHPAHHAPPHRSCAYPR